jgi:creatinine amidohydrolase
MSGAGNAPRKVQYELMTPGEILAERERCPVIFVPIGPLEWHGPHLPIGTDGLHAHHIALRAARAFGGVVHPAVYAGTETVRLPGSGAQSLGSIGFANGERIVGMDFPHNPVKSVYFEESAFGIAIRELIRQLKADPFRVIVLVNGHGAVNHQQTLRRIATEATELPQTRVVYCPVFSVWRQDAEGDPAADPGHAGRAETAIILALEEEAVRISELPAAAEPLRYQEFGIIDGAAFDGRPAPGFLLPDEDDPRRATRGEGERMVEQEVDVVVETVREALGALASLEGS